MWRFVLRENIRRFGELLTEVQSEPERARLWRLLGEAEAELSELEALSTPEPVRQNSELRQIAEQAVNEAVQVLHAHSADLQLFRAETGRLLIVAQRNMTTALLHHLDAIRIGDGSASAQCFETNCHLAVEDVLIDPLFERDVQAATTAGIRSVLYVPLRDASAKPIGVLSAHFSSHHHFSDMDIAHAHQLARSVGGAIAGVVNTGEARYNASRPAAF